MNIENVKIKLDVNKAEYNPYKNYYIVADLKKISKFKTKTFFYNDRKSGHFDDFEKALRFIDRLRKIAKKHYGIETFKVEYTLKAKKHIISLINHVRSSEYSIEERKKQKYEYDREIKPEFEPFLIRDQGIIYSLIPKVIFSNWDLFNLESLKDLTFKLPENTEKYKTLKNIHTIRKFIENYKREYHYSYVLALDSLTETLNHFPHLNDKWERIRENNRIEFRNNSALIYQ